MFAASGPEDETSDLLTDLVRPVPQRLSKHAADTSNTDFQTRKGCTREVDIPTRTYEDGHLCNQKEAQCLILLSI